MQTYSRISCRPRTWFELSFRNSVDDHVPEVRDLGDFCFSASITKTTLSLLIGVSLLGGAVEMAFGGTFFPAAQFDVGCAPYSVAIGDVDGDGKPDLVAANAYSNTVSVLLGNGDGTFAAKVDYGTGSSPYSVAIGDVNGDGKPDLVAANGSSNTVSVLLGNGDATFAAKVDYGMGTGPISVAIGDVSGDGKPDLVAANVFSNSVSVLLGNGDGTFVAKVDYGIGTESIPFSLAIGDVNGDGKPDLVTADHFSNTVSILLGSGDGTFGAKVDYGTGSGPSSVPLGDVSGDGKPDLVTANAHSNTVSILLGNGDGTFAAKVDYGTGSSPYSVAIGDVSGDGKPDLAVANFGSNTVSILLGNGDGTFAAKVDYGTGSSPISVAVGDVNGDGKPDLAVANYSSNTVSVLLGRALAAAVDLDPNVINLASHAPWVNAYIEPSEFAPTSIDISTLRLAGSVAAAPKFAVVGDHNSNGIPDLVVRFGRSALDPLLTPGMSSLELTGSLVTGESFAGTGVVQVIDNGGGHQAASVAPNPLNPSAILSFNTVKPGRVRVSMFDLQGRLVRTLMEAPIAPAGKHEVGIDGRGERGEVLPSGVYFYQLESPDGTASGRFAILK